MKALKYICLIALLVLLIGAVVFFVAFAISGFKIENLSTVVYENYEYKESAENKITSISVKYDNTDVEIVFTDSDTLTVSYPKMFTRAGKAASEVILSDSNGVFSLSSKAIWYRMFGFNFTSPTLRISVPLDRACDLSIVSNNGSITFLGAGSANTGAVMLDTDNGRVDISAVEISSSGEVYIDTDNGKISTGKINAKKFTIDSDNGAISLGGGNIEGAVKIESDNGKINLTGDIIAQRFEVECDNGKVTLENGVITADTIILNVDNGEIKAKISGRNSDYRVSVDVDNGKSNIGTTQSGDKRLSVECDNGDVEIYFTEN